MWLLGKGSLCSYLSSTVVLWWDSPWALSSQGRRPGSSHRAVSAALWSCPLHPVQAVCIFPELRRQNWAQCNRWGLTNTKLSGLITFPSLWQCPCGYSPGSCLPQLLLWDTAGSYSACCLPGPFQQGCSSQPADSSLCWALRLFNPGCRTSQFPWTSDTILLAHYFSQSRCLRKHSNLPPSMKLVRIQKHPTVQILYGDVEQYGAQCQSLGSLLVTVCQLEWKPSMITSEHDPWASSLLVLYTTCLVCVSPVCPGTGCVKLCPTLCWSPAEQHPLLSP